MEFRNHPERLIRHLIGAPFIYAMIIPLMLLDITLEIYHRLCFPLYNIPYVRRFEYLRMDRQKLSYLRWYEKMNCAYCSYANGLLPYASRIAAETEKYWCGIKSEERGAYHNPAHRKDFLKYNDKKTFTKKYEKAQKA